MCPYCDCSESKVIYTVHDDIKKCTFRRKECGYCNRRYTTCETVKEKRNAKRFKPKSA